MAEPLTDTEIAKIRSHWGGHRILATIDALTTERDTARAERDEAKALHQCSVAVHTELEERRRNERDRVVAERDSLRTQLAGALVLLNHGGTAETFGSEAIIQWQSEVFDFLASLESAKVTRRIAALEAEHAAAKGWINAQSVEFFATHNALREAVAAVEALEKF